MLEIILRYLRSLKGLITTVFVAVLCIAIWCFWPVSNQDKSLGVLLTGVHHMGNEFNIANFYVDGYSGGNVGREGGGGSDVCCVRLPYKWRQGLSVDLRWEVDQWRDGPAGESIPAGYQLYHARVPVEKYESPEHLYVHFYAEGKARVVSSFVGSLHPDHPARADIASSQRATRGIVVQNLFSKEEFDEKDRESNSQQRWQ